MAENYKHQYEQTKRMLAMYQDELIPGFRKQIEELEKNQVKVRCKDCKHWHEETGWCDHHSHFIGSDGEACHPWESSDWKMMDAEDFCSYGEKVTLLPEGSRNSERMKTK